jgi:hypothetical protein
LKPKYRDGLMSYEVSPGKTAFANINPDVRYIPGFKKA